MDIEAIARDAVDCGFKIHKEIGPGLLESVYETLLAKSLEKRGYQVERQRPVSFTFDGTTFEGAFKADLLVANALLIEVKSAEQIAGVHIKQTLTYVRLLKLPLGLLMNFGARTFKEGIQRVVNSRDPTKSTG